MHISVVMPVYNERYLVAEAIRRVLALDDPTITRLDLIVVDDGSTDGTSAVLRNVAAEAPDRVTHLTHAFNQGKGAAVRTGIAHAQGVVTVIHDADLEYDPQDFPRLMTPFIRDGADAVFGSRFLVSEYRRVLYFGHALGNRLLTTVCDLVSDLNLTDIECCSKAVRTRLLQSIPLRSADFRIEPELTIKLAKRGARMFEVPVAYAGRTYQEGKKARFSDGLLALGAIAHWWLIDDLYNEDEYGSNILAHLSGVPNFNRWMADVVRPYVGARVLEVGAGLGNLTQALLPREQYTVSDVNPHYLDYLRNFAAGKPYMDVRHVDLVDAADFTPLEGRYDTVICLNVLEHLADEQNALRNINAALAPGGRAIVLVPQDPALFGSLDAVLGHQRRYTRQSLQGAIESCGFAVESIFDFNRATRPAWWLNGRVLQRRYMSKVQLKGVNVMTWLLRRLDAVLPWPGVSLIAIARRLP